MYTATDVIQHLCVNPYWDTGLGKVFALMDAIGYSRTDYVYDWLLREISTFHLHSGEVLREDDLAKRIGVSRTPVREALGRLREQGLVRSTSTSRFTVATLTAREVENACDLLLMLDSYLFSKASKEMSTDDKARLVDYAEELLVESEADTTQGWVETDRNFHSLVAESTQNDLAASLTKQVRNRVHRFWVSSAHAQSRLPECSREHLAIAKAIAAGDLDAISKAVDEHVHHMREGLLSVIAQAQMLVGS